MRNRDGVVHYTLIGEFTQTLASFPILVELVPTLTLADRDTVRLLAPGESMTHGKWTITREAQP